MENQSLEEELARLQSKKLPQDKIIKTLVKMGWKEEDITGAIARTQLSTIKTAFNANINPIRYTKGDRPKDLSSGDSYLTYAAVAFWLISVASISVYAYIKFAPLSNVPFTLTIASSTSSVATGTPFAYIPSNVGPSGSYTINKIYGSYDTAPVVKSAPTYSYIPPSAANQVSLNTQPVVAQSESSVITDSQNTTATTQQTTTTSSNTSTQTTSTPTDTSGDTSTSTDTSGSDTGSDTSGQTGDGNDPGSAASSDPGSSDTTGDTQASSTIATSTDSGSPGGAVDADDIIGPTDSTGYEVYPGCDAVPPTTGYLRTIYVDANNGSDTTGDGSQAHPYQQLAFAIHKRWIKPGDHVIIMPGQYTLLQVSKYSDPELVPQSSSWIWLDFQPGAQIAWLNLLNINHWLVTGASVYANNERTIEFQEANNVVLADSQVGAATDTTDWTPAEWLADANSTGIQAWNSSYCVSFLRNLVHNTRWGINVLPSTSVIPPSGYDMRTLVKDNTVMDFTGDAMRPIGSDIHITHNSIYDQLVGESLGDPNHDDGMQSWDYQNEVYENLDIDHNWVQETTDPARYLNGPLQGIDNFDSIEDHMNVSHNVVLSSTYWGIAFYGATNSVIDHNTVLNPYSYGHSLRVFFGKGKIIHGTQQLPSGDVISNNIGTNVLTNYAPGVTFINNYLMSSTTARATFEAYDAANNNFDFDFKPGSVLYGQDIGAEGTRSTIVAVNAGTSGKGMAGVKPTSPSLAHSNTLVAAAGSATNGSTPWWDAWWNDLVNWIRALFSHL